MHHKNKNKRGQKKMIKLLNILLTALGFNTNPTPKNNLKKQEIQKLQITPSILIAIFIIGIILFTIIIFQFAPGTESGLVYNNPQI